MQEVIRIKSIIEFNNIGSFSLKNTLDCGQCFRWEEQTDGSYLGIVKNSVVKASQAGSVLKLEELSRNAINKEDWQEYFGFNTDYVTVENKLKSDALLAKAYKLSPGIRILKQDPWETLISFIISQNNNIPRIKKIIRSLCQVAGQEIISGMFKFPTPQQILNLSSEELESIKSGFRAKYIKNAAELVMNGTVNLKELAAKPNNEALNELMIIKGVGIKVGSCVLIYGFNKLDVVPVDVWVKRGIDKYFKNGWPEEVKGLEGVAAQYLYNFLRIFERQQQNKEVCEAYV